ncbi:hypothetical protein Acsp04_37250 [Actinomadura sp. NBRC 104425]|nr:hypothetical protein Acsp04_37250 [Actinomadura sp. NBRC 104425]
MIFTTGDTHDPSVIPLAPKSLEPETFAHPPASRFGAGMRAHAASKLRDILTVRSQADSPGLRKRGITVLAYNPGAIRPTRPARLGPAIRPSCAMTTPTRKQPSGHSGPAVWNGRRSTRPP